MRVRRNMLAVASCVALMGCGAHSVPGDDQNLNSPAPTSATNDPKLETAANAVIPELESAFPETYSGVELKHLDHVIIIYRIPDPTLDEFVRGRILDVMVVFRNAKLSHARMQALANRILGDHEYWRSQGITINGVGPMTDGSSVEVLTPQGAPYEERAFAARYGDDMVTVRAETPVAGTLIAPTAAPLTLPSR